MKDRVPVYPGRVKLVPVAGQENVYDMVRADQPTQDGDPLNKATLLKDATAALFGLGTDAVPDDVLAKLAGAAFNSNGTVTDVNGNAIGVQIATGSYVGTGKYGSSNPNSLTFEFEPKLVIVFKSGQYAYGEILISAYNNDGYFRVGATSGVGPYSFTWNGNTVSWYGSHAEQQQNTSWSKYMYVAIG